MSTDNSPHCDQPQQWESPSQEAPFSGGLYAKSPPEGESPRPDGGNNAGNPTCVAAPLQADGLAGLTGLAAESPYSDRAVEVGSSIRAFDSPSRASPFQRGALGSLARAGRQFDSPYRRRAALGDTVTPGMTPVWNPSPPREMQSDLMSADLIGDTVFSKHWLFTTLIKLIKAVDYSEKTNEGEIPPVEGGAEPECDPMSNEAPQPGSCDSGPSSVDKELRSEEARPMSAVGDSGCGTGNMNISEQLQNELCELWDMSMNPDVIKILHEYKAIDILTAVLSKSRAPRATEISIGILGNMACSEEMCKIMSESTQLVEMSLLLLETPDSPTLVETTRFLLAILAKPASCAAWLKAIKDSAETFTNVKFILESSTSDALIQNVAELVDLLMDRDDELCELWASEELHQAVLEAMKQIGPKPSEGLHACLHILQLLTTHEAGVSAVVSRCAHTLPPLRAFLTRVCDDDLVVVADEASSLASAHCVLRTLLTAAPEGLQLIFDDTQVVRCALKILEACGTPRSRTRAQPQSPRAGSPGVDTARGRGEGGADTAASTGDGGGSEAITNCVRENVCRLVTDGLDLLYSEVFPEGERQSSEDANQSPTSDHSPVTNGDAGQPVVPSMLNYMNDSCDRKRLVTFVTTLRDQSQTSRGVDPSEPEPAYGNHVHTLTALSRKFHLHRLEDIISRCTGRD